MDGDCIRQRLHPATMRSAQLCGGREPTPLFSGIGVGSTLHLLKEREQGVWRVVATQARCRLFEPREGLFFHGKIGFDVAVGSVRAFMPEPQGDDVEGDPRLQQMHCGRVPAISLKI